MTGAWMRSLTSAWDAPPRRWRTATAGGRVDRKHRTQFKQAMDRLGIHLEPASQFCSAAAAEEQSSGD